MKNRTKMLLLIPAMLLSACNFKYTYKIAGMPGASQGGEGGPSGGGGSQIEDSGTYDITVWVDDKIVDLTRTQIQQFVSDSMGKYTINAKIEPQSESTAAASMLQDVQSGADLFVFAQDQLARLKVAGALSKLTGDYATFIRDNNSPESVKAGTIGHNIYAYPITNDNGYFLYYDKSVMSAEDASDMTTLLAKCKAVGKKLNFEAKSNGFYSASYFLATGCTSTWDLDEESGKFTAYHDDFSGDKGLIAAKGLRELDDTSLVATNALASKLGDTAAAVVSGIWEYEVALKRLGDNLGCAELPYFTVDGTQYHLGSFDGFKLMGVKPQVDAKKASVCRKLAQYLTGTLCQTQRFQQVAWGPTNNTAAQNDKVLAHPGLAALRAQHEYASQQGQCPGAWFNALATTAKVIKKNSTEAELQNILNNYKNGLPELLSED